MVWRKRILRGILALIALAIAGAFALGYRQLHRAPSSRLGPGQAYPDAPESERLHYLDLPLDHSKPEGPTFRGYYALSPKFRPGDRVVFVLIDGQMELDDPHPRFDFFDEEVPVDSYVIIGHRGHFPTLFPEVYPDGKRDLRLAMQLYGSWQQVDDIEAVRRDMAAKGLLPPDGKVEIFGASGAGVLAQQYLHRYPDSVSRALLVSTGAPDARRFGGTYARDYEELEPGAEKMLRDAVAHGASREALAYVLFQLGREGAEGLAKGDAVLRAAASGDLGPFRRERMHLRENLWLANLMLSGTSADAVRVRMFELAGRELRAQPGELVGTFPIYDWTRSMLGDFLAAGIDPPDLTLDRAKFGGEVLAISGREDVVFSPRMAEALCREYPRCRFISLHGGHRLEVDRRRQMAIRRTFLDEGLRSPELDSAMPPETAN